MDKGFIDTITPAYNAFPFIERAIASIASQPQVRNIIVIDDGSTDGTYEKLVSLKEEYAQLKVLNHERRRNRGIAATRNVGLLAATSEYVAFLDADDYYLADRFATTQERLKSGEADGVYEPVVNAVVSAKGAERFAASGGLDGRIIGISNDFTGSPFEAMYFGKGGVVHLNGLTLKRSLAIEVGLFDEELRIVDDGVFRLKAAYKGILKPGSLQPVAVRTIHDTNNEPGIRPYDNYRKYVVLHQYLKRWGASRALRRNLIRRIFYNYFASRNATTTVEKVISGVSLSVREPNFITSYLF